MQFPRSVHNRPHANDTRQGSPPLYQSRSPGFVGVGSSPSSSVGLSRHQSYDSSSKRTSHPSRLRSQSKSKSNLVVVVVRSNSPINQVLEICLCVGELPAIIEEGFPLRPRLLGFALDKRRPPHGQIQWEWASYGGTFMDHATSIRKNFFLFSNVSLKQQIWVDFEKENHFCYVISNQPPLV